MSRGRAAPGHLSIESYRVLRSGKLAPVELLDDLLAHLAEVCPGCAGELEELASGALGGELQEAVERGLEAALGAVPEPPPVSWQTMVDTYLALPHASRLAFLETDPWAVRVELALALVERARDLVAESRSDARELVDLAFAAAGHAANEIHALDSAPQLGVVDALTGAWAVRAEADLLDERPRPAQEALLTAQLLLLSGSGDPNVIGALAMTQALFEWKEDDTEASVRLLTEAAGLFRSAGEPRREALAWVRLAVVLEHADLGAEAEQAWARVQEIGRQEGFETNTRPNDTLLRDLLEHLSEEELGGEPS